MIPRLDRRAFVAFTIIFALAGARTTNAQRASAAQSGAAKSATVRAPQGDPVAGISCDAMEGSRMHTHQHLVLIDHGKEVSIPADVGQRPGRNCLYWVHTHTADGIIHIESPQPRTFTLADFFTIWGQPLSRGEAASMKAAKGSSLRVWVNGKPYTGDIREIPLLPHTDIVIEAGPPFVPPPKFTNWGSL